MQYYTVNLQFTISFQGNKLTNTEIQHKYMILTQQNLIMFLL